MFILIASLVSTHYMLAALSQLWHPIMSPDIAKCPLEGKLRTIFRQLAGKLYVELAGSKWKTTLLLLAWRVNIHIHTQSPKHTPSHTILLWRLYEKVVLISDVSYFHHLLYCKHFQTLSRTSRALFLKWPQLPLVFRAVSPRSLDGSVQARYSTHSFFHSASAK